MSKQVISGKTNSTASNNLCIDPFMFGTWEATTNVFYKTVPIRVATTLNNLYVKCASAPGVGTSYIFTVHKNGSATALTCTVSGTDTTAQDIVNSVSYAADDTLTIVRTISGSPAAAVQYISYESNTANANHSIYGSTQFTTALSNSAVRYNGIFASKPAFWSATQTIPQNIVGVPGDLTGYRVLLNAAPGSGKSYTFAVYKASGLGGTLTLQDGSGGTVDTRLTISDLATSGTVTFTLPLAAEDVVVMSATPANTPTAVYAMVGYSFSATTAGQYNLCGITEGGPSSSATNYTYPWGYTTTWSATESDHQLIGGISPIKFRGLTVLLLTAPGASKSWTFDFRLNSGSPGGNSSVTISGAGTPPGGSDSAHTDDVTAATDLVALREVPSGTPSATTSVWWVWAGVSASSQGKGTKGGGKKGGGGINLIPTGGTTLLQLGNSGLDIGTNN